MREIKVDLPDNFKEKVETITDPTEIALNLMTTSSFGHLNISQKMMKAIPPILKDT